MAKIVRIRQKKQARNSESYSDSKPNGLVMETDPLLVDLESDLNNLRSQLRRVIDKTGKWYDDPATDLASLVVPATSSRKLQQALVGAQNGVNLIYTTAEKFRHNGTQNESLYLNGIQLKEGVGCDYIASESTPTTGYDTITMAFEPVSSDNFCIDFTLI